MLYHRAKPLLTDVTWFLGYGSTVSCKLHKTFQVVYFGFQRRLSRSATPWSPSSTSSSLAVAAAAAAQHTASSMSLSSDSEDEQQLPGQQDEEWEEWDGDEEEDDAARSLFCDVVLPSPEAAFEYDATHYGFDIRQFKIEVGVAMVLLTVVNWWQQ